MHPEQATWQEALGPCWRFCSCLASVARREIGCAAERSKSELLLLWLLLPPSLREQEQRRRGAERARLALPSPRTRA